ncbi:MAG: ABC transporter permease, partial [Myxococcota bacterium]|nr:ABC transporter permease [Myxococcota bacterium]
QYWRWLWGYEDTTGGEDEIFLKDGRILLGRLSGESNQQLGAKKWSAQDASLVLRGTFNNISFIEDGQEIATYEQVLRIVRRQVDLGKPAKGALFFTPEVESDAYHKPGTALGTFYQLPLKNLQKLGATKAPGEGFWELEVSQNKRLLGTVRLAESTGSIRLEPSMPADKDKLSEQDINRAQEQNIEAMLVELAPHAQKVGELSTPMQGWVALSSTRPQQVVPWQSMGMVRSGSWRGGLLWGNLGWSLQQEKVSSLIAERIVNTLRLMFPALLFSILIALPLGMAAAVKQHSALDHGVNLGAFLGISLPVHWFGLMLIHIFAVWLGWFPVSGMQTPGVESIADKIWYTVLPVTVLSIAYVGRWLRYMRASMLEVIKQDYIRTARAKGVSETRIVFVHALRNALIPVVTILALSIPTLFGGALITETVFAWPGMGSLIYEAIITSDYYVAIVGFLISATLVMAGNLIADMLYAAIDPRVRLGDG